MKFKLSKEEIEQALKTIRENAEQDVYETEEEAQKHRELQGLIEQVVKNEQGLN